MAVCRNAAGLEANYPSAFDFHTLQVKILSPEGKQSIGSTRFTVSRDNSIVVIKGETKYTDGERDSENERLLVANRDSTPMLGSYEHSFFNAAGTRHMVDTLDAKSRIASCTSYSAGQSN